MIIIEGPDGSGKTTLAKRLGGSYRHAGPPRTKDVYLEYRTDLLDSPRDVVWDRFYHGQRIYGPVFRGGAGLSPEQVFYLELMTATRGGVLIVCLTDLKDMIDCRRNDSYAQPMIELVRGYMELVANTRLPCFVYDRKRDNFNELITFLKANLKVAGEGPFVGCGIQPKVLLVGDTYSDELHGTHYRRPFDTGEFFLQCLMMTNLRAHDICICNSFYPHLGVAKSLAWLRAFCNITKPRRIVALGSKAAGRLTTLGIPHQVVRHPQHPRRFEHHRPGIYALEIREAMK